MAQTMVIDSFTPPRNRDASAIIRGFVYQVDLTIERWLELQDDQVLELERGEDIDLVSHSFTASPEEHERLIEQVKLRSNSITLRSSEAISAIACALEHHQANSSINLVFRYTTNAQTARERLSPLPKEIKGIDAWERIRSKNLAPNEIEEVLKGIRTILIGANKPEKLNSSTWEIFLNFFTVATNDQFINLIHRFEWSTKATEAVDLSSLLERTLIEQGFADNETQAKEKYQRLFFYVFKLLTQTGLKRLTPDTRNNQLSLPPLSAQDRILLDNIINKVSALEKRVDTIEFKTSYIALEVSLINNQVNHLSRIEKMNATVNYTLLKPILDVPPLVSHLSNRTNNINKLRDLISKHTWLFIYGGAGWGKTQLATLLIRAFNSCKGWIRLRRLSTQEACLCLDTAFSELFGEKPLGGWREWYLSFCNKFENATIIVIDDLPRISLGDGLSDRLLLLAQAFHSNGLCLLTTSSYNLPSGFQDILNNQILNTFECPPFDDLEATELFRAYNAPELFLANIKRITLLNSFAKQHPFVLNALSKYLDSRNWQFTMNEFQGVIKGEYISALTNDTIINILETVEDSQSRELLYRLNLILGDFSFKEVQSLASVKPVVERPLERLHSIIGLWVQQEVSERLLVSPLVAPLRSVPSLLPDTTMECHLYAAS